MNKHCKGIANFYVNNVFLDKKGKSQQQNKKANIKFLARGWNRTRGLLHRSLER